VAHAPLRHYQVGRWGGRFRLPLDGLNMGVTTKWRSAALTDPGRLRAENQDRSFVDDTLGIFLVVDGLGGHAAGEKAAETAVEVIPAALAEPGADTRQRVRRAIAAANNRICDLAEENQDWRGMACVLTLAVLDDDRIIVGHVGDSRLYLIWNGAMRKLTSDHSPVGEREDRGELSESEAMAHPRRHEVFRDVGTRRRESGDEEFVEMKEFLFKPDAAILLCSDGLSDLITSAEMSEIIDRYDGDADQVARDLVDAANRAGGKDNITVVFVAGSEFLGNDSPQMLEARARHAITRARESAPAEVAREATSRLRRILTSRVAFLIYGFAIGVAVALALR
jgi:serine/threonine protein phosphatase PrpC